MNLRNYQSSDVQEIAQLFYDTIHTVNLKDYTQEQVDAWATGHIDLEAWDQSFLDHHSVVVVEDDKIIGFGDMDKTGYLDGLNVHKDHQGRGVATMICDALEAPISGPLTTHASITARPFFEKRGYHVVKQQQVVRRGVYLTNFVMKKEVS